MITQFGPEAKNGDYVIVLDSDYIHREGTNYLAKVVGNKAYTGRKMRGVKTRYIHKISAVMVVPESIVPEETKKLIEEDILLHTRKAKVQADEE